jgi:hypothetical protein
MSFQAYIDSVQKQTGLTPKDFAALAAERGLTKHGEIVAWLKSDYGLGHGHANAIAAVLLKSDAWKAGPEARLDALFSGTKAGWRAACDALIAGVAGFGPDAKASTNETYVNLLRATRKFAIIQPASAKRLDIGIKLVGLAPAGRLEAAGSWNAMVTHRVRIADPAEIDAEVLAWLRAAYDAAEGPRSSRS